LRHLEQSFFNQLGIPAKPGLNHFRRTRGILLDVVALNSVEILDAVALNSVERGILKQKLHFRGGTRLPDGLFWVNFGWS
jgi:hypothetical protein